MTASIDMPHRFTTYLNTSQLQTTINKFCISTGVTNQIANWTPVSDFSFSPSPQNPPLKFLDYDCIIGHYEVTLSKRNWVV